MVFMKKVVIALVGVLVLIGSFFFFKNDKKEKSNNDVKVNQQFNDINKDEILDKVNNKINEMSTQEKIAQMIVIAWRDPNTYEELYNTFRSKRFGGFILFRENMDTLNNTREFVKTLKNISDIPLIVSIDEEGGLVSRLKYIKDVKVTDVPYMYYLGKTNNEALAYDVGRVIAEELRVIGVNVVHAPVIDIYSNLNNTVIGKRSFGSDYLLINKMAGSLARGLEDNGVIPTYKHYPGHGDTAVDSHKDLPIINKSLDELKAEELQTFKYAIDNKAKLIMVGHIALPKITGDNTPASLSKVLISDVLKDKLGYKGLVITDALNMRALTDNYTNEEIVVKAIDAGVDILLMPEDCNNTIEYIKENISEERINESVKKILYFKYAYLDNYEILDKSYLGSKEHQEVISKIPVND